MTHLMMRDELLDAQLLRAVGSAAHHGADVGECLQAVSSVDEKDLSTWYAAWKALADRTFALAQAAEEAAERTAARDAYLRACTYHRTSGAMLYGLPGDPRMTLMALMAQTNAAQTDAFRRAAALLDTPVEVVEVPFEGTTLPGYFLTPSTPSAPSAETGVRRATVIGLGGYDGTCEELYFFFAAPALARGYNVLIFDGPGQGAALLQQGLPMRPDWETVVTPVVDYLLTREDVDGERIALAGLSLGGFLGPKAAAKEHRLAALVADSGSFDMYAMATDRIPGPLAAGYQAGKPMATRALRAILGRLVERPTAGWGLRRGMAVHGVGSPLDYFEVLKDFRLQGHAQTISCPTLVTYAEGDDIGASAPQLFASLTVTDKTLVQFTAAEGAGDHCEAGARTLFDARAFGWLDQRLHPEKLA